MHRFCVDHKETGMVNVLNRRCCERCAKIPVFILGGQAHVRNMQCERCAKQPVFINMEGERVHRFCAEHKETGLVDVMNIIGTEDMHNLQAQVDVPRSLHKVCRFFHM